MKLIEFIDNNIKVNDEALLVAPFRKLYNKDRSKNKEFFIQQMSVIFFLKDPRSNYNYIINEKERLKEILIQEGLPEDFKISEDLQKAMEIYEKLTMTTSLALLQDVRMAVDKVRKFLKDIDLDATDDKGKPIYTINNVMSAIKLVPQLAKDLTEAERSLSKEIEEQNRARGNSELTLFDNGFSGINDR